MNDFKTLIAVGNENWNSVFSEAFRYNGHKVHSTSEGETALHLAQNNIYDHILIDDSLRQMQQIEFVLNLKEVLSRPTKLIISGDHVQKYLRVWNYCGVKIKGTRDEILKLVQSWQSCQNPNIPPA